MRTNRTQRPLSLWLVLTLLISCLIQVPAVAEAQPHEQITLDLIEILDAHPDVEALLVKSIDMAREINPDPATNPAQSLEAYFAYLDWSAKAMPWTTLKDAQYPSLYERIDQCVDYFYFILDMPLPELEGRGYYYNSLQYAPELQDWIVKYCKTWGEYLSTEASWSDEYYALMQTEQRFNLDKGWYEDPSNWKTWNEFFARHLSSPDVRPIASPSDDAVLVSPADSKPQGVWRIDANSDIASGVQLKSTNFASVRQLLSGSPFADAFAGGTLTHTFLNVDDYHRYHFPISGTVVEVRSIAAQNAAGGITTWDSELGQYKLESSAFGWQTIETRGLVVLNTREYGLVALLPIGMSQISSVLFDDSVQVGAQVRKGDPLGCFQFGGSDIVMLFQSDVRFDMKVPTMDGGATYEHLKMGEPYAVLSKAGACSCGCK